MNLIAICFISQFTDERILFGIHCELIEQTWLYFHSNSTNKFSLESNTLLPLQSISHEKKEKIFNSQEKFDHKHWFAIKWKKHFPPHLQPTYQFSFFFSFSLWGRRMSMIKLENGHNHQLITLCKEQWRSLEWLVSHSKCIEVWAPKFSHGEC